MQQQQEKRLNINERVKIPTEVTLVFERRVVAGTYVDPKEAQARRRERDQYGAVVKGYVANARHGALVEALREVAKETAPGLDNDVKGNQELHELAMSALREDATFTWFNE